MASNSVQLGCAKTSYKYTLSVDWSESDADISGNTSLIKASASLSASNVGFDALYDSYAYIGNQDVFLIPNILLVH